MKHLIVYDEESEWDMTLCSCESWETAKLDGIHEEGKHDIRFIKPSVFINHNASTGMNGTILSGSNVWEVYVHEHALVKEFNSTKEAAIYFFNLLIEEGYGYSEHDFLNDFFNNYADERYKRVDSKLMLLYYILDAMGK